MGPETLETFKCLSIRSLLPRKLSGVFQTQPRSVALSLARAPGCGIEPTHVGCYDYWTRLLASRELSQCGKPGRLLLPFGIQFGQAMLDVH